MKVVYAKQDPPKSWKHAIFLVGPTPRDPETPSWRPRALELLEEMGYDGVVFSPEPKDGKWKGAYTDQTEWEKMGLEMSDRIPVWVPRDMVRMPALTTNVEFGRYVDGGKVVLGFPKDADKMRYLEWMAGDAAPDVPVLDTLKKTLEAAIEGWKDGPIRKGGERYVPRLIWDTPMFQNWYDALKKAGNRLDEAKVLWIFTMPKAGKVLTWVLWVKVWIAEEGRFKQNEFVFARSDISCVVLYRWPDENSTNEILVDAEIVLVKEFRSPARTSDGFIRELPGGSSTDDSMTPLEVAKSEVEEETGLELRTASMRKVSAILREASRRQLHTQTGLVMAADRFKDIGSRQVAGTLLAHHAFCFAVELDEAEMKQAKTIADSEETHGVEEDSEITYLEIVTVKDLLANPMTDWATLGMVFRALA